MSRIAIDELEALLAVSSRMRDEQVKELNQLNMYLNEFLAEQQLKGTAIDSTKRYYEVGYLPLLKATIHTLDLLIEKIETYIRHFYEDVDHTGGRLDSQLLTELEDKIGRYERDVESLKKRMSAVSEAEITPKLAKLNDSVFSMYKEKEILDKYLAFEERHRTFFSEIESISYNLQSGLRELAEKVSFTDIHKGYDISGLSKHWQEFIQKKNKEFDEREKAGGKEAERLKEYTIIKCVDPLTGKVTWGIEKNGLGVIDPELQAYLDKVGDGLSEKDYDILEITPKEWAERVNNAWKRNGTDYFSGNQYGSWLSALAHGQDFMDGIKESGVYDALWGLGTLASAVRNINKMNQISKATESNKTSGKIDPLKEQVLKNIENSKEAREASNFKEYLKKENSVLENINGVNKILGDAVVTNLGNKIDIKPYANHQSVDKNPGPFGEPNTSIDIVNAKGEVITRRFYDSNGRAIRDVDMTNHGNPKNHPEFPHEHNWSYDSDGNPTRN